MSKVDKIFETWSDLEKSYDTMGNGLTRSEFMKKLVGYKSLGNHGINYILTILLDEVNNSGKDSDKDKFSILADTFKSLSNYLDLHGIPVEIVNLNAFLIEAVGLTKELLTEEDLYSMYNKSEDLAYEIPYSQMIKRFGCVYNHLVFEKDKSNRKKMVSVHYVGIENVTDKLKVFYRHDVYDYIMSNSKSQDSFVIECAKVLAVLVQSNNLEEMICISSPDNISNSTIFGIKMEFIEIISVGGLEVAKFKLNGTSIYCLC